MCGQSLCSSCLVEEINVPFCSDAVRVCDQCATRETPQTLAPLSCDPPRLSGDELRGLQEALAARVGGDLVRSDLNLMVRNGVPCGLRATIWPALLRCDACPIHEARAQSPRALELLAHDLPRTFSSHEPTQAPAFMGNSGCAKRSQVFFLFFFANAL